MAGYTRQSASNIVDDGVINASDFNDEYNAIETAFNASTGHVHDGTAANGARILEIGPSGDFTVSGTAVIPLTTNTLDIGSASVQFKDMYLDGTLYADGLGEDILVATDKKTQFRDTAIYINSSADGQLDIVADTEVQIATTTLDINANTDVSGTLAVGGTGAITGNTTVGGTLGVTGVITATADIVANSDVTFADNGKAVFGNADDLQVFHDGSNSYVKEVGDGDLILQGVANVRLQGGGTNEDMVVAAQNGAVTLYHNNSPKIATTATGIDVTGNATFADNGKAIFGASSDLQVYHDGSNSYVRDSGTGELRLTSDSSVILAKHNNENMLTAVVDGAVTLYYDSAEKFATSSTGVDVTGTLDATGASTLGSTLAVTGATTLSNTLSVTGNASVGGNATISGNLTVSGTTFTVDSTVTTLQDPILTLGGNSAPASDDNKDRGLEFRWHNGSAAKVGFFGFDDSTGRFTFIPDATNTSEVFSGTKGTIDVAGIVLNGTEITATAAEINKLDGVTASTAELNLIDGVTATTAELNYVDGVTSNIQTQLNAKQATLTTGDISTALIADDAVTADKIADNAVGTAAIATDAVTATEIAANAVGASEIAANAVGTSELATDSVTSAKIAANAVTTSELNISGNGTAGQAVVTDGDGSFSYSNLSSTNAVDEPAGSQTLSSTTYTALDTTTITPSSTSAKILVMVMAKYNASGGGNSTDGYIQIKRDSTEFTDTEAQSRICEANESGHDTLVTFMVDSPSTTSAITYTLQGRKSSNGQNIAVARTRISAVEV